MKFLDNLSITKKLITGFGVLLSVFIIFSLFSFYTISHAAAVAQEANTRAAEASTIEEASLMGFKLYAVFADAAINQKFEQNQRAFDDVVVEYKSDLEHIKSSMDTDDEKRWLAEAHALSREMFNMYPEWISLTKENKNGEISTFDAKIDEIRMSYFTTMQNIYQSLGRKMERSKTAFETSKRKNLIFLLITTLTGLFVGVFAAFFISMSISVPLGKVNIMLKDISEGEGDLTKRIETSSHDEIGDLSRYFNKFVEKLQIMIKTISSNVSTVASAATELSASSTQIAARAEEMNTQTTTVAAAAEQTATNIGTISSAAEEMSMSATSVAAAIEEMSASILEVAKSCQNELTVATEANEYARNSKNVMDKLGTAAQSISKVIATINKIADQTNLLALNATIEAASAGDAGRGFAVVANEVKELSKQTAQATREIKQQIDDMQANTTSAVAAIEQVFRVIGELNTISQTIVSAVEEQSATVHEIAQNVGQVNSGAQEVARNVSESAQGLSEVNTNISSVSSGINDTARSISQVKTSADELAKLSETLRGLVGQFKV